MNTQLSILKTTKVWVTVWKVRFYPNPLFGCTLVWSWVKWDPSLLLKITEEDCSPGERPASRNCPRTNAPPGQKESRAPDLRLRTISALARRQSIPSPSHGSLHLRSISVLVLAPLLHCRRRPLHTYTGTSPRRTSPPQESQPEDDVQGRRRGSKERGHADVRLSSSPAPSSTFTPSLPPSRAPNGPLPLCLRRSSALAAFVLRGAPPGVPIHSLPFPFPSPSITHICCRAHSALGR
jgi:hypothetical protein